jgi:hypothetical protein
VRSDPGKNEQEPKKRSTVVSSKKKWTVMKQKEMDCHEAKRNGLS